MNFALGKKVIVRTYAAGVWYGVLEDKNGSEVVLCEARRMWNWYTPKGISMSEVSKYGIVHKKSRICEPVDQIWLEAIEIIPCTPEAIVSIEGAPYAEAQ